MFIWQGAISTWYQLWNVLYLVMTLQKPCCLWVQLKMLFVEQPQPVVWLWATLNLVLWWEVHHNWESSCSFHGSMVLKKKCTCLSISVILSYIWKRWIFLDGYGVSLQCPPLPSTPKLKEECDIFCKSFVGKQVLFKLLNNLRCWSWVRGFELHNQNKDAYIISVKSQSRTVLVQNTCQICTYSCSNWKF